MLANSTAFAKNDGVFSLSHIETRLAAHLGATVDADPSMPQAAVAIILRERERRGETVTDVLFIRRAEKDGDPWSGHMAFPGGHRDPEDDSLLAAACRETEEEIGITLSVATHYLGALDQQRVEPRLRPRGMLIAPFVFKLTEAPEFLLNHEVAEVVWTPLTPIAKGANHTQEARIVGGQHVAFDGYRINGGHFVWGLTYRVLHAFFGVLDAAWRPPNQGAA